jgi:hypothetical protein
MAIWEICGRVVYIFPFWYIVTRKIWQPSFLPKKYTSYFSETSRPLPVRLFSRKDKNIFVDEDNFK